MAEEVASGGVHPGSWLGDGIEEFKKAPPAVKAGIVVAFVAVIGIGYYEYNKGSTGKSATGPTTPGALSPADTSGAGANVYPTVPGGNTGTVPVLPGGLIPIFDKLGNLIGFEPAPTNTTTPPATPPATPPPGGTKPPITPKPAPDRPPHHPPPKGRHDPDTGPTGHGGGPDRPPGGHKTKDHQANGSGHTPTIQHGHTTPTMHTNRKVSAPGPRGIATKG